MKKLSKVLKKKSFRVVFNTVFILLIFSISSASAQKSELENLHISLIDGDVMISTEDIQDWIAASINMPLRDGDRIWTPEGGRVELRLWDGTYIRMNENSSLDILSLERHSFQGYLHSGSAYINFKGLKDGLIQIDTTFSSIQSYKKSIFRIDVPDESFTEVSVYNGIVYAENRDSRTAVTNGKNMSLSEYSYAEIRNIGPPDDWERWNRERDRRLTELAYSRRYLPEELSYYSYDFDNYGRWVYVRDYGYCWTPTVVLSVGWAPYRSGRWVWMYGDYVWISYEPWGWVPYHYGRWVHIASTGWCWVPPVRGAVYWGPGFVAWVHTPTYVAWVPLAPGEIYYGYGYFGPYSVNILNVNINNIMIKNKYRNVYVKNAITIKSHDSFMTGKKVAIGVNENPFLKRKISVGRPNIKPDKKTFMPVIKEIPSHKLPPSRVRNMAVKELKVKHSFKKQDNKGIVKQKSLQKPKSEYRDEIKRKEREPKIKKAFAPAERNPDIEKRTGQPLKRDKVIIQRTKTGDDKNVRIRETTSFKYVMEKNQKRTYMKKDQENHEGKNYSRKEITSRSFRNMNFHIK